MASIIWQIIYYFLIVEIGILFILLIPLPGKMLQFLPKLTRKLFSNKTVVVVIIVLLGLMFIESINTRINCVESIEETDDQLRLQQLKINKFRAESNIYISFDSLFLMFLIWRISDLLEEVAAKKLEKKETPETTTTESTEEKEVKEEKKEEKPVEETTTDHPKQE